MDQQLAILLVSNPDASEEIVGLLAAAGLTDVRVGTGGDDTIEQCAASRPDVVVMCATLEQGDARSLAAAIKGGGPAAGAKIVLIGDATGPIRNALDASEFEVERFVGRPLSAKALGFAVRAVATGAARGPGDPGSGQLDQAMDAAIASFVDEAMSTLGGAAPPRPPPPPPDEVAGREPTLILSGGGAAQRAPGQVAAPPAGLPPELAGRSGASLDDDDALAAELDALEQSEPGRGRRAPARDERGLGMELRKKMTAMAERLFPALGGDRQRVNAGLAHDAHTEIDLTAIGLDSQSGTQAFDIGSGDTFADTSPLARLEPTPPGEGGTPEADTGGTTGRRRNVTGELPARGDLAALDVASLFARLWSQGFTGRVVFRQPPAEKVVQLDDGRPVFAASNLPHDRMGDLLYREGKITRDQHRNARDLVIESGRRMGEILVELGFIKPRELLPTVRRHLEDVIYSLFGWASGEFVVTASEPTGERIRLTRHPAALVLEGVRRKYEGARLAARLGTAAAVVAARPSRQLAALVAVADLSPAERTLVGKLDGERTLEVAARAAELEVGAAQQLAYVLVALGVAEVIDRGQGEGLPTERPRGPALVGETDLAIDRQRVLTKHALVEEADYFMLLGVRRDATGFEIRRAYEAARRDFAAEGFPADLQRELATEISEINQLMDEAYQVLRDDRVRASYLGHLRD